MFAFPKFSFLSQDHSYIGITRITYLAMNLRCQVTMDRTRRLADQSNGLQGFLIFHSFGGRKIIFSKFSVYFLRWYRIGLCFASHGTHVNRLWQKIQACILHLSSPSGSYQPLKWEKRLSATQVSTSIVEPYNAVLYTHTTLEHCDCAFLVDNQAIYDLSQKSLGVQTPTYTNLNRIIAQVLSSVTASLR